ncbi:MAG TPA: RNA-binding protein [Thermopetrobacter sp.]|nr:RNA-binding protein [Thermopetrobacter sp.]
MSARPRQTTPAAGKAAAMRTCIATGQTRPRADLLRFVRDPDGRVVFDFKSDLPGRGAWIVPERAAIERAVAGNAFARAFKAPVKVAPDLADDVARRLRAAALSALSLGRKAGVATSGFGKVSDLIAAGDARALIFAAQAAADGKRKLIGRARKAADVEPEMVDFFASDELSLAFSRPNVIHAAMKGHPLTDKFLRLARLARACAAAGRA